MFDLDPKVKMILKMAILGITGYIVGSIITAFAYPDNIIASIISEAVGAFLGVCVAIILEFRRRNKENDE